MLRRAGTLILLLLAGSLSAQETGEWSWWAAVDATITEDSTLLTPVVMADRGGLHLEARWNYESKDAGSLWAGRNVTAADESWVITPMIGAVFGDAAGVAAGLEAAWERDRLDAWVEAEHFFSRNDDSENFTYAMAELAVSPTQRFRAGVALQWLRSADADDVLRGGLVGLHFGDVRITAYAFEPGSARQSFIVTLSAGF